MYTETKCAKKQFWFISKLTSFPVETSPQFPARFWIIGEGILTNFEVV
jgi:hypothetical protein